jgi:hypothetical protein
MHSISYFFFDSRKVQRQVTKCQNARAKMKLQWQGAAKKKKKENGCEKEIAVLSLKKVRDQEEALF